MIPTRLDAAKQTAIGFVQSLSRGAKVGLVAFSSAARVVTSPTHDHDRVIAAIRQLIRETSTAIGNGLLAAVYALPGRSHPAHGIDAHATLNANRREPLPPAAVILLSDGRSNTGTDPYDAALIARRLQVQVYTVALRSAGSGPEGLDEATLNAVAEVTGGAYQRVASATALRRTYQRLGRWVVWVHRPTEVTSLAALGVAALLISTLAVAHLGIHRLG